jgi:hypothetical protein
MTAQVTDSIELSGMPWQVMAELPIGPYRQLISRPWTVMSACWRGYVADWLLAEGTLSLRSIEGLESERVFVDGGPALADWLSGTFRIARGERLSRGSGGYGRRYTDELSVEVYEGRLMSLEPLPPYDGPVDVLLLTSFLDDFEI